MILKVTILFLLIAPNLNGQQLTVFNTSNSGLPDNTVNSIAINDSIVWVATPKGLARFNLNKWEVFTKSN